MYTLLQAIYEFRLAVDDLGGDLPDPPSGYSYFWESDDSSAKWKNEELTRFFNWSRNEISIRLGTEDATTTAIKTIAATSGTRNYALDSRILTVSDVYWEYTRLTKSSRRQEDVDEDWRTTENTPERYVEDDIPGSICLVPVPAADGTISLRVTRMPLAQIAWTDRTDDLTDPDDHLFLALIEGMKSRAYRKKDTQTYNEQEFMKADTEFAMLVGPPISAAQRAARKYNANLMMRVRPVKYY